MVARLDTRPPGIVGHGWVLDLIERSIGQRSVGHAYLITGFPHVGKFTTAMAIAGLLLCPETPACGLCRHCSLARRRAHPDLQVLELPADRRTIPLRDVHELMRGMALRPLEATRKVYIIRGAEDLAEEGANALLKTLEEPPGAVTIILTAPDPAALLPTIVSRCQIVSLNPVAASDIAAHLVDALGVEAERAEELAVASGGRPGWAVLAAEDPGLAEARDERAGQMLDLLTASRLGRISAADALAERWSGHADEVRDALQAWSDVWHDVLMAQSNLLERIRNRRLAGEIATVAGRLPQVEVQRALASTLDAADMLERNAHPRLALETYALFLPRLPRVGYG